MRNKLVTGLTALILSLAPALPSQSIYAGPNKKPYKKQTIDDLPTEKRIKAYHEKIIQAAKKYEREVIQKGQGDYKDILNPERALEDYEKIIRSMEKDPSVLNEKGKTILKNWDIYKKDYEKYLKKTPWINPEEITRTDKLYLMLQKERKEISDIIGEALRQKFRN